MLKHVKTTVTLTDSQPYKVVDELDHEDFGPMIGLQTERGVVFVLACNVEPYWKFGTVVLYKEGKAWQAGGNTRTTIWHRVGASFALATGPFEKEYGPLKVIWQPE